jgi:hypothetical protein
MNQNERWAGPGLQITQLLSTHINGMSCYLHSFLSAYAKCR